MRRTRQTLFVLLFVSYAYFYQAGGWNQNSRFNLVRAITNEHTLNVDPFRHDTGDKAYANGHYYSDKAPGLSLAATPLVAVVRPVLHAFGGDPETYAGIALLSYLSTVFTCGLMCALAGVALFTICLELGASAGGALCAALTYGLATPMWPLATIFIGHGFAAALLVLAFLAAMRVGSCDPAMDLRQGAIVGFCAGWATVSEFPAAVPAVLIALVTLRHAWPLGRARATRVVGAMAAMALACVAILMAYQYACFGSPFHIAYSSEPGYVGMQQGVFGVTLPKLIRLRRILTGEYRGLLPIAPTLIVAPIGLVALVFAGPRPRRMAITALAIAVYFVLLNASYAYWEGGWSYGPRHAEPAIPFLCIGLGTLWTMVPRIGRWLLTLTSACGAAITLIAVSTMPLPPADIHRPISEFMLPAFIDGDLSLNTQTFVSGSVDANFRSHREPKAAFNLGMKAGLHGHASVVPLALVWMVCGAVLIDVFRRRRSATEAPPLSSSSPVLRGPA
jgi:hypothetical protein